MLSKIEDKILKSFLKVSLVSVSFEIAAMYSDKTKPQDLSSLRVLRSLRAFRPLRAMSRFEGIKVQ